MKYNNRLALLRAFPPVLVALASLPSNSVLLSPYITLYLGLLTKAKQQHCMSKDLHDSFYKRSPRL